ncbi:hypothetical protein TNCV_1599731 [Trichonephila clavipes]|nr:hypothetical protein TNCV_1599731 [Trichonephila clavipes]
MGPKRDCRCSHFHKRILFSDEAHFWLNGYINKQNCRIWSEANPQVHVETALHPEKLTVCRHSQKSCFAHIDSRECGVGVAEALQISIVRMGSRSCSDISDKKNPVFELLERHVKFGKRVSFVLQRLIRIGFMEIATSRNSLRSVLTEMDSQEHGIGGRS